MSGGFSLINGPRQRWTALRQKNPDMEPLSAHPELERLLTHQDWLRSLARKLVGDSQAAEDLVQETWMAAMKSPPDPDRPARPWLAGVVRRLASMRARGEGRRTRRQNEVAVQDLLPSTADLVEEVDTQRRLVGEVLKLSEPYRTTVMLRYFNNLSSAEIARHQDVPAGTVRWRLKRGLDELRERLDDSFGSREAWGLALLPLAKLGVGSGAATATGGGGVFGFLSGISAAKMVASILAVVGTFWLGSLIGTRLQPVMASTDRTELSSLEPEVDPARDQAPERVAVELSSRDLVAPATRTVRFLKSRRDAIPGLRVLLDDGTEDPPMGTTDMRGEVVFTTGLERGTLYVRRPGSFLQQVPVEFNAPKVDAFLPWHSDMSGRVLAGEDGGLAKAGLRVRLDSDVRLWGEDALPRVVRERFGPLSTIEAWTDDTGTFRFQNLPADWSGKLWLPDGVCVKGASRRDAAGRYVYFAEPDANAVVLVTDLPTLRGRVVGTDGKIAPQAMVRCWVDGAQSPALGITGFDGAFEIQLDSQGLSGMRFEAVSRDGMQQQAIVFAGHEIPRGFDLGDVVLLPSSRIAFMAQNSLGEPIRGARVLSGGELLVGSATDEEGLGEAILPPNVSECTVVAAGYQPAEIALSGTVENRLVELVPANVLRLHVLDSGALSMPKSTVRVWSGERLFEHGEPYAPSELDQTVMEGSYLGTGQDPDLPHAEFQTDDLGKLDLIGVVGGVPLWVEVVDPLGKPLHQQQVTAMGEGETRTEKVMVPQPLRQLHGIVRDRAGNVLVGVNVSLVDGEGNTVEGLSGLDGKVVFTDLSGDRYDLSIDKRGFVALTIPDFSLSQGKGSQADTPAEFILDRGQDVAILVVDLDDQPVLGGVVRARRLSDDKAFEAGPKGAWDQTLQDLDQGALELTLTLGGVEYVETMQAPLETSVEFRVPAHGASEVIWNLPEGLEQDALRLVAVALDENGGPRADRKPVVIELGSRTGTSGVSRFEALLPGTYSVELQRQELREFAPVSPRSHVGQANTKVWLPMGIQVSVEVTLSEPEEARIDGSDLPVAPK